MVNPSITDLEARLAAAREASSDPVEQVDALNALSWALRTSEPARANTLAAEARDLAREQGYVLGQARATRTMAMTIRGPEDLATLVLLAEEARRLFDESGDAEGRAGSRDFLASLHEHVGDLSGGLELALDALSIARELGDPVRKGYALSSVGGILAASGEVGVAVERLKEALHLFEGVQDTQGIAAIRSRLCKVLKTAGLHEQALEYAVLSRDAARQQGDAWSVASALRVIAEIDEEEGRIESAERLYREAVAQLEGTARNLVGAGIQVQLGRLLINKGELGLAEVELVDAHARVDGDPFSVVTAAQAHEALAELREKQGGWRQAVAHLKHAQVLKDQISQRDARNKLAQVEARATMDAAKKDAEIHRLRFVELHAMQSKLLEAERMALLGKLAAGTSHELNTPLGVLSGNTKLAATATQRLLAALQDHELGPQVSKLSAVLESCRTSSQEALVRIQSVAESFQRFTQLDRAEMRTLDLNECLLSALDLLKPTMPAEIVVHQALAALPNIVGWPRELSQAFMTVLQNAVQAIHGPGRVEVRTGTDAEHVWASIADTGRGMSSEEVEHLFDVAWSAGGARSKMRFGLSAAQGTVQRHGGRIEVQSKLQQGTIVRFVFPLPQSEAQIAKDLFSGSST